MRRGSAVLALCCLLSACAEEQDLGPAELTARGARLDAGGAPPSRAGAAASQPAEALQPETGQPEELPEVAASLTTAESQDTSGPGLTAPPEEGKGDSAEPEDPEALQGRPSSEPADTEPSATEPPAAEAKPVLLDGNPLLTWNDLTLPDERVDDLVDALLYPESYPEEDRVFPEPIARHDGQVITIEGYMVPLEWAGERVRSLMLVGDLLACCFGTAPEPDAWVEVVMEGEGAEYFVQLPVLVTGTFRIEGLDDGTGYAAGCYTMKATSLVLNED